MGEENETATTRNVAMPIVQGYAFIQLLFQTVFWKKPVVRFVNFRC